MEPCQRLIKKNLKEDLQTIKDEGKERYQKIRDIIRSAISATTSELKVGSQEIRAAIKEAILTTIEVFQERGTTLKEEVTASVEGAVEGIAQARRNAIATTQTQVKELQDRIDAQEQEINQEVEQALSDIEETTQDKSAQIKEAIQSAVEVVKESEEVALLRKRYAQLKAQIAVIQANLAGRHGERYEDVKHYLDEAKNWYERAKAEPEVFIESADRQRQEFEGKLNEAGAAAARKERQLKGVLRELWHSLNALFEKNKPQA
ncbi:MAG: histidine kinase [Chloroflexaceae bacterium]|nr:histidine kinase [Chloroflexaceae bacterium]